MYWEPSSTVGWGLGTRVQMVPRATPKRTKQKAAAAPLQGVSSCIMLNGADTWGAGACLQ